MKLWAMETKELSEQEIACLLACLPLGVREHIAEHSGAVRQQSLWAYSLLRFAVWENWGSPLPEMRWLKSGKPCFSCWSNRFCSISHTERAVLVGLSDCEIGVDLEKERPAPPRICEMLRLEPASFFAEWVRLEACAKCLGMGVLPLLRRRELSSGLTCCAVETFPGYWAGAAVQGGPYAPVIRLTDPDEVLKKTEISGAD